MNEPATAPPTGERLPKSLMIGAGLLVVVIVPGVAWLLSRDASDDARVTTTAAPEDRIEILEQWDSQ